MKNRKINFIKLGIFLFGITLILQNCEKEEFGTFNPETNENIQDLTFKEAIDFFNQKNTNNFSARESNPFTVNPNWETIAHQQLVYADASLVKADADINREGNYQSQLIFINISGQIKNVICTTYKDKTDVDGNMIDGRVYFNETNGTFLDAYKIEDKLFTKRLVPNQESNVQQAGLFLFLFQEPDQQDCWNTDNLPDDGNLDEVVITVYRHQMLTAGGNLTNYSGGDNYHNYVNNATGMNTNQIGSGGLSDGQITDAAGAILSSPPIDENQCLDHLKNDFGDCVEECREGKTYNETTKKCECTDPNQIENFQGNCVDNPCRYINLQIQNPNYTQQANELEGKTGLRKETGYKQNKDGSQVPLNDTNNGHSLVIHVDSNTTGYMHTHLDDFIEINSTTGKEELKKPIKIFSPADVLKFLQIVRNTKYNGVPTHLVYGTVIASTGNYTLRFTGNVDDIVGLDSANSYTADYKKYIKDKGRERGFLHFLKDKIGINGINLYRIRNNGDVEKKTLKSNGKVNTNDCE